MRYDETVTSVRMKIATHKKCKELDLKLCDVLETGMKFILAERGDADYNPDWQIVQKLQRAMKKITEMGENA